MMDARAVVRGGLERALLAGGVAGVSRRRLRGRALVLAYHDVLPDGAPPAGEASLHLPRRELAAQLDLLAEMHDVVPLTALLAPPPRGSRRPRAAVTFDDAYRGALAAGLPELVRRGLPATVFVAPGCLGAPSLWWDALVPPGRGALPVALRQRVLRECNGLDAVARRLPEATLFPPGWGALPVALRQRVLRECNGLDAVARRLPEAAGLAARTPPAAAAIATEAELEAAARLPGITLGAHGWSHPNLASLDAARLEAELTRPLAWLRARFPRAAIPWLAYPYGLASPAVERAARAAGYEGALRIDGGWVRDAARVPFAIPRLNVPAGLSRRGFALRAAGLLCGR